jgi:hypothetical protein
MPAASAAGMGRRDCLKISYALMGLRSLAEKEIVYVESI